MCGRIASPQGRDFLIMAAPPDPGEAKPPESGGRRTGRRAGAARRYRNGASLSVEPRRRESFRPGRSRARGNARRSRAEAWRDADRAQRPRRPRPDGRSRRGDRGASDLFGAAARLARTQSRQRANRADFRGADLRRGAALRRISRVWPLHRRNDSPSRRRADAGRDFAARRRDRARHRGAGRGLSNRRAEPGRAARARPKRRTRRARFAPPRSRGRNRGSATTRPRAGRRSQRRADPARRVERPFAPARGLAPSRRGPRKREPDHQRTRRLSRDRSGARRETALGARGKVSRRCERGVPRPSAGRARFDRPRRAPCSGPAGPGARRYGARGARRADWRDHAPQRLRAARPSADRGDGLTRRRAALSQSNDARSGGLP